MSSGLLLLGVHAGAIYEAAVGGGGGPSYTQIKYQFFNADGELPGTTSTVPVNFTGSDTLESGSNTASTLWFVSTQGVSTNDLVIWHIGWDDSTNVTAVTASTAPDGGAISTLTGPVASQSDEVRSQVYWKIASTSWAVSTTAFTPSASESWTAVVLKIPAGQFNSTTPFGAASTYGANSSTGTAVSSPALSATTSDAVGRLVAWLVIDTDPISTTPTGWTSTNALDLGAVAHGLAYRTSTVASAESIPNYMWTIAGDSSANHAYILRSYVADVGRTSVAAVDTSTNIVVDADYGVQVRVENSVSSGTDSFKWQYKHVEGTNTWTDISAASNVIVVTTTESFSHGDDVPEYLTGSGVYATDNNATLTSTGALTLAAPMTSTGAYESHLNFQVVRSDVTENDTVQMRIVQGDGVTLSTYTQTPALGAIFPTVSTSFSGTALVQNGTFNATVTLSSMTIIDGPNLALFAGMITSQSTSAMGMTWNGSSMTLVSSVLLANSISKLHVFSQVDPAPGNLNLVASWTGNSPKSLIAAALKNVDQTTPYVSSDSLTRTSTSGLTASTGTVSSSSHDATIAWAGTYDTTTPDAAWATGEAFTVIERDTTAKECALIATYNIGGTADQHTFTSVSSNNAWGTYGIHVKAV